MKRALGLIGVLVWFGCGDEPADGAAGGNTAGEGILNGGFAGTGNGGTGSGPGGTGTAGTSTNGQTSGDNGQTSGDGGSCEVIQVKANRAAPDMLILMDASGSMVGLNFSGGAPGVNRWNPAVNAVNTLTSELEQDIQFGLMVFPAGGFGCGGANLDVPMAVMNAQPIANVLGGTEPLAGNTPTSASLANAREVLAQREPVIVGGLEGFPLPQYVMLVTDGDPNCVDVTNPLLSAGGEVDTAAQQNSIREIEALASMNVQTYVIGIDTAGTNFASVLDQMAVAGGTGDTQHRSVSSGNAQELIQEFQTITSNAVTCSFLLQHDVNPQKLIVTIDGEEAVYGQDWSIRDDMRTVDLLEGSCNELQLGATVEAQVVCEIVNII